MNMNTTHEYGLINIAAIASAYRSSTGRRRDTQRWLVTKGATESIAYLEKATGTPRSELAIVENGVGTWIHPDLVSSFMTWINKDSTVEQQQQGIYLIQCAETEVFKIGITQHLPTRLTSVQGSYPFDLLCLRFCLPSAGFAQGYERRFHQKLKPHQLQGGWYGVGGLAFALSLFDRDEGLLRIKEAVWSRPIDWQPMLDIMSGM